MRRRSLLIGAFAAALSITSVAPARAASPRLPGPALHEPAESLARALTCPTTLRGEHEPVLLVHATGETGARNFATNYGRVLPAMGYDVCTVELVDYGLGDIQASAERMVYAIRTLAQRTHRKVQVIGHSEGPLPAHWALQWWPDLRTHVDDLIAIASPFHGWLGTDAACAAGCGPALWQMRRSSHFMAAANSGDETPGAVYDAAVYAMVLDALTHRGPADLDRLDHAVCAHLTMPGTTPADLIAGEFYGWVVGGPLLTQYRISAEPAVAGYARSPEGK